ncbi:hypothetical protein SSP24_56560 [Streptomyces spinoverrucosus]|uniref:Prevent-host-death protein n=1 Tax=Streptomyces spinoverrucosus TaxID=284043 RepID=A0A4Y3VQJ3_9ACTN|nr:hypothetical protein [Streptomyces spinoverrucosus]GEC08001.1 hypothetical protein SSP24_56560 [Streptomyces spinoverrucosus]GHB89254.1 hypothetical protein GCM10010397_71630 [Streptomyces spinoverrucosus]
MEGSIEDFGRLVALVEETGERVMFTMDGQPVSVILPVAGGAELEHSGTCARTASV